MNILNVENIIAGYNSANVLQGVSISLSEGEIVSVVGRNGAGKTTLVRSIIGLLPVRSGTIEFSGNNITQDEADVRARSGIGYVPQGRQIFSDLTVQENLRMGGFIGEKRNSLNYDMVFELLSIFKTAITSTRWNIKWWSTGNACNRTSVNQSTKIIAYLMNQAMAYSRVLLKKLANSYCN